MQALPTLIALAAAIVLTPPILRHLSEGGFVRDNWRGVALPFPAGIAIVVPAILVLGTVAAIEYIARDLVFDTAYGVGASYLIGVALLGLIDDLLAGPARGWRGHGAALRAGGFSTGALKAVGSLALALYFFPGVGPGTGRYLLAVALLVLTTNLFNLLDLRPGRAGKAFVLVGAGLAIGAGDVAGYDSLWVFGPFAAPILVVAYYDLREQAMLGDTGANLIGGLAGVWMIATLDVTGQAIALAVVLAITIYGEFRSISALIERTPLVRQIDSIGRNVPHA